MARKALIVDDEVDLGQLLAEHLRRWGFEPTIMTEGKGAVDWARQEMPEVILLDLMLPDIDGYSICETLKLDRDTNRIPIIMTTALSGHEDLVRGLQVGADRYLTKPFTSDQLHQAINDAFAWQEEMGKHGTDGAIRFHLQSDTLYLEELNHLLGSLFLFSGLTPTQIRQLTTAVRELGQNAIEWGHQKKVDRIVTVDYRIDPEKVTIDIKDTGPGFNPQNLPHAASQDDPVGHMMVRETLGLREGGFGILMSRGLVDELTYNEKGNEVRLVKYCPPRPQTQNGAGSPESLAPSR
jgi:CheY-like chemotaxis protein/anti-sigma regulatory factor (Ser/Thr protein kinase)